MKKGTILLLNGVSSSGKSTLARALVSRNNSFFHLSVDGFGEYLETFENSQDDHLVPVRTERLYHRLLQSFSDNQVDVIADHILHDEFTRADWFETLGAYPVLYVGVMCDPDELDRRERNRGDRRPGQGRGQLIFTHHDMHYDLEVDTSRESLDGMVDRIMAVLEGKNKLGE